MEKVASPFRIGLMSVASCIGFYIMGGLMVGVLWAIVPGSLIVSQALYVSGFLFAAATPLVAARLMRSKGRVSPVWRVVLAAFVVAFCFQLAQGGLSAGPPFILDGVAAIWCVSLAFAVIYVTRPGSVVSNPNKTR